MKAAQFNLESLNGISFNGFTTGRRWNGWACPYFSFEEGKRIIQAQNELTDISAYYSEERDVFVFEFPDEAEEYAPVNLEDKLLYPIGSSAWVWQEAETIQL